MALLVFVVIEAVGLLVLLVYEGINTTYGHPIAQRIWLPSAYPKAAQGEPGEGQGLAAVAAPQVVAWWSQKAIPCDRPSRAHRSLQP